MITYLQTTLKTSNMPYKKVLDVQMLKLLAKLILKILFLDFVVYNFSKKNSHKSKA